MAGDPVAGRVRTYLPRGRRSRASEFAAHDAFDEGVVFGVGEQVWGEVGILGVAECHEAMVEEGRLDAVRTPAAEAAAAPLCVAACEVLGERGEDGEGRLGKSASDYSRSLIVL